MNANLQHSVGTASNPSPSEARCECGQLVAKLGVGGIELKCKRCKRLVSIPFSSRLDSEVTFQLCPTTPSSRTSS